MSVWNWLSNAAHTVTAPLRVVTAPVVATTRFMTTGAAVLMEGKPLDQALATGASATKAGFIDDVKAASQASPLPGPHEAIQSVKEIKDVDPSKLSKSIDKAIDSFTFDTWSASKKFWDSTKLTNLQETQDNAVESFQRGDIGGTIVHTLNLNSISNGLTKAIEDPEQIQPPSGESVAQIAMLPLDYKTKGLGSKMLAVSDSTGATKVEQSITDGWNALVQGRLAEASQHFINANPVTYIANGLEKGDYFSNLSAPDKDKVLELMEKGITNKYDLDWKSEVASDYGQANEIRESIKDVLDGNFDKVFTPKDSVYTDFLEIAGQASTASPVSADVDDSHDANEIAPTATPNELSKPSQELTSSQPDLLTGEADESTGNYASTVREFFGQSDSVTRDALTNTDTEGSPSWFHMHHDDGINDGYLDVGADASGFDSFLLQNGSDLIAPVAEPFADADAITDLVTGKSSPMETVADPLLAAGPLDAVTVGEPRNNDF